jgi:hypothetical protein
MAKARHHSFSPIYLERQIDAVSDYPMSRVLARIASKDETRPRPFVFEPSFRTTIFELEFLRIKATALNALENFVGLPLLQEHNLERLTEMVGRFTL